MDAVGLAFGLARRGGHIEVERLLVEYGADTSASGTDE